MIRSTNGLTERTAWRALVISAAAVFAVACAPALPASTPISSHQRFAGYVNGTSDVATVQVVCSGQEMEGGHGRAVPGQHLEARLDPTGQGYTGDNGAVFVEPNTSAQFVQLRNWSEAVEFPTDIDVPCRGPGTIVFDPCFGIVGCRGGAHADAVKVSFVNVAP